MEDIKKFNDFPENKENPFLHELSISITSGHKTSMVATQKGDVIFNQDTGEVKDNVIFLATKVKVDKDEFVKIFVEHIGSIFDLSKAAQKTFVFILSITRFDDKVIFDIEECMKQTGYTSKSSVYKSLAELALNNMIAKSNIKNVFFINPAIFYKGDRMFLVKEYHLHKKEELSK
jgi:hypothetical protein